MADQAVTGDLGVGSFNPLTGHGDAGRKQLCGLLDRLPDLLHQAVIRSQDPALKALAEFQDHPVQLQDVIAVRLIRHPRDLPEFAPFPGGVQHRKAVLFLISGNVSGGLHPLLDQPGKFPIDPVDLCSAFF